MPEDRSILPDPELLRGFTVSGVSEKMHYPPPPIANGSRLTAEQVREVKRLIHEGMAPQSARAKVLGLVEEGEL